MTKLN